MTLVYYPCVGLHAVRVNRLDQDRYMVSEVGYWGEQQCGQRVIDGEISNRTPGAISLRPARRVATMRRRFERFRQASGLADKSEEHQVNTPVYTMGDEADDILRSQGLTDEEKMKELEKYFVKRHNPNYERAKFNQNRRVS